MSPPLQEWGVPADRAELAVLAVHGRGQDPAFMRDTSMRFGQVPVRFFAPEADGNTWYPLSFLEPVERNEPALGRSLRVLEDSLVGIARAGFDARRVVLWGFSQGACLLSHLILTAPRPVAGLVLLTGGYLGTEPPLVQGERFLRGVPAVVRSVENDPWVPRDRVEATADVLRRAGAAVDVRIDPGDEHIITDEACRSATDLLAGAAARTSQV
ncbi:MULTISPECIES: alpha/beta hydrolase [Prauserella salsuginis group]|uniref:Alpha/beta hydrolase n=1 Tax=Prauserella salsuginis TaxID=387889 RepID=A0ABW6GBD9_9PSEU|nr:MULTISPECIES: phospholipase [Prauserella salsuginis group]MCR3722886.1 phospholipase/carboxylesterase [Prauserella flava]MCR3737439.1 phospholipase/carboxylesterase [Prauserella salsuginis]